MRWEFVIVGFEGSCELFGVNIFDYHWDSTGQTACVQDPAYGQNHTGHVYKVTIGSAEREFLACQFSNGVWGFYLHSNC